jgi:parallel beta-helix repeat protein
MLALVVGTFLSGSIAAANPEPRVVQVNCSNGKTLAKALERGNEDRPLLVLVQGVCNETVTIERSDVTLRGEPGAAINGPDPALDTLTVSAHRVAIEGLAISGGRNGIRVTGAGAAAIRGTTVQLTGRTGIIVADSSNALIDGCTVQLNPRDGVSTEASHVTLTNSNVSQNGRIGVFIASGTAGRIGIDNNNNAAGNTISQNGSNGVAVVFGSTALIGNNSITQNGTDPAQAGRSGISVIQAAADIAGGNSITGNTGQGIFARSASVQIGDPSFAFSTVNTITDNGDAVAAGGVFAFLGSALVIRDAVISNNRGFGVGFSLRSHGQLFNSQILNNVAAGPNPGDGIRLLFGSALLVSAPSSTVTGNAGAGLQCIDGESSVLGLLPLDGNGIPGSPGCTGF